MNEELIKKKNIMGYYDEGFNEWSEAMASIVDEEDETSRDIAYYLASGIIGALYSVANELHAFVYCNTCDYTDDEDYCDYCHRKSMNWSIAPWFAEDLADAILENKEVGNN